MSTGAYIRYLLEAAIGLNLLYLFYRYYLYDQSHFRWNRWYLLVAVLISLLLPAIHLPVDYFSQALRTGWSRNLIAIDLGSSQTFIEIDPDNTYRRFAWLTGTWQYSELLILIYLSGILLMLSFFLAKLWRIRQLIKQGEQQQIGGLSIITHARLSSHFSFGVHVFLGTDFKTLAPEAQAQILAHERIHVQQRHSLDVILFELVSIILWFNPLNRRIKRSLKDAHEFIVDNIISNNSADKGYARLLLQEAGRKVRHSLANGLAVSQIKSRLWLLMHPEPAARRKMRFLVALPVIMILLAAFSITKDLAEDAVSPSLEQQANGMVSPLRSGYQLACPFFINKRVDEVYGGNPAPGSLEPYYQISHPMLTFTTDSYTPVYATAKGIVQKVIQYDNWGVEEVELVIEHEHGFVSRYKGLERVIVAEGQNIEADQTIGYTGDKRLYPSISYQLLKDGRPVDPLKHF